eukprot:scaffold3867_cov150-Ochromonas_danica.AAC.6
MEGATADPSMKYVPKELCGCAGCLFHEKEEKDDKPKFRSFVSLASDDDSKIVGDHVKSILQHNHQWVKEMNEQQPDFFKNLAKPQKPKYLYFGCSDSRVPANQILGLGPGEVFVHRNVGNQVPINDLNALSVLEYAVTHLGVTDIIVTGHYDCGAIRAATSRQDLGTLEHWLRAIRDVYRLHRREVDELENDEDKHLALVELNVIEQCINIYKTGKTSPVGVVMQLTSPLHGSGVVQRKRIQVREELLKSGRRVEDLGDDVFPRIHGMVFNPTDGLLKKLPVDFERSIGSLDHIYGLYEDSFNWNEK